jgi:hypothetical protein
LKYLEFLLHPDIDDKNKAKQIIQKILDEVINKTIIYSKETINQFHVLIWNYSIKKYQVFNIKNFNIKILI